MCGTYTDVYSLVTRVGFGCDLALLHGHVQGVGAVQEFHNLAFGKRDAVLHRFLTLPALPMGLALHKHSVTWLRGPVPPAGGVGFASHCQELPEERCALCLTLQ